MAHDAALLPVMDSGGCRDDMETDGGADGCTPRAGKVGPRSNPGPYFLILKSEHCRFTEDQIIGILREQEAGAKTVDVCRKHGSASFRSRHRNSPSFHFQ